MPDPHDEFPVPGRVPELLAHAEQSLSHATFRLGRLRSRHRGGPFSRDFTAVFYDLQAARQAVVGALEAMQSRGHDDATDGPTPEAE